ncbi:MAG: 5'/3'-nucleotidase SurE [Christensenellales bacterium]|jgi:5'-nucleotidase
MRILVVNDDGIHAKGIKAIAARLAQNHDVTVVSPESEKSATSHSITINRPLRVSKAEPSGLEGIPCYVIDGLPVDCTKIGISHIMKSEVDLVVSGINHGFNMGSDIIYSGTVAAALDAVIMGYRALAVSIASYWPKNLDCAADIAAELIDGGLFDEKACGVLYNLNVPDLPLKEIKGLKVTCQGRTAYKDAAEVRKDPRGNEYIWMKGDLIEDQIEEDTDISFVKNGYASITPIKYDLTDRDRIKNLNCKIEKIKLHT